MKNTTSYVNEKNVFTRSWATLTYDFVVLTSLTHLRKIVLVVLQIGKAKDLSAHLHTFDGYSFQKYSTEYRVRELKRSMFLFMRNSFSHVKRFRSFDSWKWTVTARALSHKQWPRSSQQAYRRRAWRLPLCTISRIVRLELTSRVAGARDTRGQI
jgi:hypothetical protein